MAKLTAAMRDALPDSAFALPGRQYPIHNRSHARNALARVAADGTPDEQAKVKAAVKKRYPDMGSADKHLAAGNLTPKTYAKMKAPKGPI